MPLAGRIPSAPVRGAAPAPRSAPLQRLASAEAGPGARPSMAALTGRGGAQALPDHLKTGIEGLAGVSMAGVTVHYNSEQPARVGALAYAQGAAIHLARGQERHLAHEAWHVAQQRQGRVRARGRIDGRPVNDDGHLEREADRMGAAVERMGAARAPDAARTQAPPPAMDAHAPIQGRWPFSDDHAPPANIAAQVAGLRATLATANTRQRGDARWYSNQQDALHATEATVTAWLRTHGAQATEAQRQTMAGHLHALEDHHTDLVGVQRQHNHPLWLPAGTSRADKRLARGLWTQLQNNAGNLTVHGSSTAARGRTLADFAKLLQQPHGRGLIRDLNDPTNAPGPVRVRNDWGPAFRAVGRDHEPGSWATTFVDGDNNRERPAGAGSYVQVDRGVRGPSTGGQGDRSVPTPHYLTLGHELGHALRNRRGQYNQHAPYAALSPLEQGLWTEPEEHANITLNENAIRAEHGLPARAFHKPPETVRVERLSRGLKARVNALPREITPPDWANPYVRDQTQFGRQPGAPVFDQADETTYGQASQFFTSAHRHIAARELAHIARNPRQALRNPRQTLARGASAAWAVTPGPREALQGGVALAQGAWNRIPTGRAVAQGGLALAQGVWHRMPSLRWR